jgi:hypothetical protein
MIQSTQFHQLNCLGRDGIARLYWYRFDHEADLLGNRWHFQVNQTSALPPADSGFDLSAYEYDSTNVFVHTVVTLHRGIYGRKGIRDSLYPEIRQLLGKGVFSSSNRSPIDSSESRNPAGEAVWRRLLANSQAYYDPTIDRYFVA